MKLIAQKKLRYPRGVDGKEYEVGDVFEVLSERDAKALTLVRAATIADDATETTKRPRKEPPAAPAAPVVQNESMQAVPPMTTASMPNHSKRYNRRDMSTKE